VSADAVALHPHGSALLSVHPKVPAGEDQSVIAACTCSVEQATDGMRFADAGDVGKENHRACRPPLRCSPCKRLVTRSPHDRNVREQGRRRRRFRLILPSVNSSSRALWRNMLVPESARFRKKVAFSRRFERQRTRANGLLAETEGLEPLL